MVPVSILMVLALGAPQADKEKVAQLKEIVKAINTAVGKSDVGAATSAFGQAEGIRGDFDDKALAPLAAALGKGAASKNTGIAIASLETLGKLKIAGSSKQLGKRLNPPGKVKEEELPVYKAAIAAAGAIHDTGSVKALEKLLSHANGDIGAAAAEAFGGYSGEEPKARLAIAKRLVKVLAKLEKKVETTKEPVDREPLVKVQTALVAGLGKLMNKEDLAKAADWEAYLKEAAKNA